MNFRSWLRENMMVFLVEGRLEQAQKKYTPILRDLYSPTSGDSVGELIRSFSTLDPSDNLKYFDWMMKRLVKAYAINRGNLNLNSPEVIEVSDAVEKFHKNSQRLKNKDINSYKTVEDVVKTVDALGQSKTGKKKEVKSSVHKLYEDENVLVIRPETHDQVCLYGAGSRWCITERDASHYSDYVKENTLFYMIFHKKLPEHNVFHKVAYSVERDKDGEIQNTTFWDTEDNGYTGITLPEEMIKEWPQNEAIKRMANNIDFLEGMMDDDAIKQPRRPESFSIKERIAIDDAVVGEVIESIEAKVDLGTADIEYRDEGFFAVWSVIDYLAEDMTRGYGESGNNVRQAQMVLDGHDTLSSRDWSSIEHDQIEYLFGILSDDLRAKTYKIINEKFSEELEEVKEWSEDEKEYQIYLRTVINTPLLSNFFEEACYEGIEVAVNAKLHGDLAAWVTDNFLVDSPSQFLTSPILFSLSPPYIDAMVNGHVVNLYDDIVSGELSDFEIDYSGFDEGSALEYFDTYLYSGHGLG